MKKKKQEKMSAKDRSRSDMNINLDTAGGSARMISIIESLHASKADSLHRLIYSGSQCKEKELARGEVVTDTQLLKLCIVVRQVLMVVY